MRRALKMLWASPNTLLGVLLGLLLGALPYRVLRGQVWQWRASWGLWRWLNGRGFIATTFGNVSIFSPGYADDVTTQKHECVHVAQCYRWGPLFLPLYLAQWMAVGFEYGAIPWEVEAYRRQLCAEWAI